MSEASDWQQVPRVLQKQLHNFQKRFPSFKLGFSFPVFFFSALSFMGNNFKICLNQGVGSHQGLDVEYWEKGDLDGSHSRPKRSSTDERQEWFWFRQRWETKQVNIRSRRYVRKTSRADTKPEAEAFWPYCQGVRSIRRGISQREIGDEENK